MSMPPCSFDFQSVGPRGFLARDLADSLAENPDMAFRIAGPIGSIAIELAGWFLHDDGACRSRIRAMRVNALLQMDMDCLRILAPDRGRGRDQLRPFGADLYKAITEAHP
jgi:hypothetical protein